MALSRGLPERSCLTLAALMLVLAICGPAHSSPLFFNVEIAFDSGTLSGETFRGSFSVDGDRLTGVGDEVFAPNLANELLSFDISVSGTGFGLRSDIGFPDFPVVGFTDGVVSLIDYLAIPFSGPDAPFLSIFLEDGFSDVEFTQGADFSFGTVTGVSPTPVPEPATAVLLAAGLLTVMAAVRRRHASVADRLDRPGR